MNVRIELGRQSDFSFWWTDFKVGVDVWVEGEIEEEGVRVVLLWVLKMLKSM